MRKFLKIAIFSIPILFASCAKDYAPKAVVVPRVTPKVEQVEVQAKKTTVQATKTVVLAEVVKERYKEDKDVAAVVESAVLTEKESKKTEFELEFLKEYSKNVDIKVTELAVESEKKDEALVKQKAEIREVEQTVNAQKQKISSLRSYLIAGGSALLILLAIVIKPWRWI